MNDEDYVLLSQKLENEATFIELLQSTTEPQTVSENVATVLEHLVQYDIEESDTILKHVISIVCETLKQIYANNNATFQSLDNRESDILHTIRGNLKIALILLDSLNNVLTYLIGVGNVAFSYIPSFPNKFTFILLITFEYCKKSQEIYKSVITSITEMLDLFKKAQELHTVYLKFLDSHLVFDFGNESQTNSYKEILGSVFEISKILSGVNIKSLADNWKGFISLLQKSSKFAHLSIDLSPALAVLTREIDNNLQTVVDLGSTDVEKSLQVLKVTGFLIRVALKLLELDLYLADCYEAVFSFWMMIFGWKGSFLLTSNESPKVSDFADFLFDLCTRSLENQLLQTKSNELIRKYYTKQEPSLIHSKQFALLVFMNVTLRALPNLSHKLIDFRLASHLRDIFNVTKACYAEFFYDYDSQFYEDFVVNLCVAVLMFPQSFPDVEKLLLENVIDERIWTALIASDVWCLVLKHASDAVCRHAFRTLVTKLRELKYGMFQQNPVIVRLKTLTRRIFCILPKTAKQAELPAYNPSTHLLDWRIISTKNIPLSHRYYVELMMTDLFEKYELIGREECKLTDLVVFMQNFDIIAQTNFTDLQINGSKLLNIVLQLWSSDLKSSSLSEDFRKHFLYTLGKITIALSRDLSCEDVLTVLHQFRDLSNERHYNLIICDVLSTFSRRDLGSFPEKQVIYSLIINLFCILLKDKNVIVLQRALTVLDGFVKNDSYNSMTVKIISSSNINRALIVSFMEKNAPKVYDVKYLESIADNVFTHNCDAITGPALKKFKSEVEVDSIINCLTADTENIINSIHKNNLNLLQVDRIKSAVKKLETILNCN